MLCSDGSEVDNTFCSSLKVGRQFGNSNDLSESKMKACGSQAEEERSRDRDLMT